MKLWSKQLEAKARKYPLYSQDGKGMNAKILVKYFNPYGAGTWLITEAEKQDNGDWLFFGYCHIFEWEWGYVTLSELMQTKVKVFGYRFPLERDLYIPDGMTVGELARHIGLPLEEIKIVMVNGRHSEADDAMRDGDRIAFFPAVGGG